MLAVAGSSVEGSFAGASAGGGEDGSVLRRVLNFNREWRFLLGDRSGAEAPAFDESAWEHVGLPHSFSLPYFAGNEKFYVGYGWYRKALDVPPEWAGKRVFLEFEGVFQEAEIFVNGRRMGGHAGGYTGFSVDITDALTPGKNTLAVRVNNKWNSRLAPRAGEHVFSGGIYRDVNVVVLDPLHVAWCGTQVTTPAVSKDSATVNVKTEVVNSSAAEKSVTVKTSVIGPDGKVAAAMRSSQQFKPGSTAVFDQTSEPIANPKLWHPDHPNLYAVRTIVLDGDRPVDGFTSPLGFRWFEFTPDKGLFLNGEHFYLKGANVHQDQAGWGDAATNAGFERDIRMIKDAGFNFIRGSHYPHDPAFSEACDRLGMIFWSENCFWGTGGFQGDGYWDCSAYPVVEADKKPFEESVRSSLREMIRIHRNHPSILVWSMSNEPFFSDEKVMADVRRFLEELSAYSRELDPTRPAAIGGAQRGDIDKLGDIAGYNGDGARLAEYIDPGVASVVSEYGSTMCDRPGDYDPGWGDLPAGPRQDESRQFSWRYPWRSGEAVWCGFDHGSIAGRKFGSMGIVDYFRLPKRAWYWYRKAYRDILPPEWPAPGTPAGLKLSADKTVLRGADGTDDALVVVTVIDKDGKPLSNSVPVSLCVEQGPGEFPTGPAIEFAPGSDIAIRDGQAAIAFRSYYAGESVIKATSPELASAEIRITTIGGPEFVPGVTPPVKPRPYVRYEGAPSQKNSEGLTLFGRENPTRTNSEAPGHSSRFANDGNPATFWQAASGGAGIWWQVDLERIVAISSARIDFPREGAWRYKIEVSEDGLHWKLLSDQSKSDSKAKERTHEVAPAVVGRFVRVTFVSTPPGTLPAIAGAEFGARLASP